MTDRMMQFFAYEHLPPHLQKVSATFWTLANYVDTQLPANPERTVALRKLLEAKDCAVRAVLYKEPQAA
jgi:ferritin-like protein